MLGGYYVGEKGQSIKAGQFAALAATSGPG